MLFSVTARADEVEDILVLKARYAASVGHLSFEAETEVLNAGAQASVPARKVRYHINLTRWSASIQGQQRFPWSVEVEMFEPTRYRMLLIGTSVSIVDSSGVTRPVTFTETQQKRIEEMVRLFIGNGGWDRDRIAVKVLRRNRPWLKPHTTTLEYIPLTRTPQFSRMEEDIDGDGLGLRTRLYDPDGRKKLETVVTRKRLVNGMPFAEVTETTINTSTGDILHRSTLHNIVLERTGGG